MSPLLTPYIVEIYSRKSLFRARPQWRWRVKHRNGKTVGACVQSYSNLSHCEGMVTNLFPDRDLFEVVWL